MLINLVFCCNLSPNKWIIYSISIYERKSLSAILTLETKQLTMGTLIGQCQVGWVKRINLNAMKRKFEHSEMF
jgi:hypothetical protein